MATIVHKGIKLVYDRKLRFSDLQRVSSMEAIIQYLAKDPNLTNAFATVVSASIALLAFLVSLLSLFIGLRALTLQHRHNVLSVKPLATIGMSDYENLLQVRIYNNGLGPMIIKNLIVKDSKTTKHNLIDWMPELPPGLFWETVTRVLEKRSLPPEGEIVMLRLQGNHTDTNFQQARDACRKALSQLTVEVQYVDIYDTKMPLATQGLSYFGRHTSTESAA